MMLLYKKIFVNLAVYFLIILITGCGGGSSSSNSSSNTTTVPQPPASNNSPVISPFTPITVNETVEVSIEATVSDSDGSVDKYEWVQESGPDVELYGQGSSEITFDAPETARKSIITLKLIATDNNGASASQSIEISVYPKISGTAVDDIVVGAVVKQISLETGLILQEVITDEAGEFSFKTIENIGPRFLIELSGGKVNGVDFTGEMSAICDVDERHACHITPISTLVKKYADTKQQLLTGSKDEWIAELSAVLNVDLTVDPFIEHEDVSVDLALIRTFINNGENLDDWVEEILTYVREGENNNTGDWFNNANLAPTANAGDNQSVTAEYEVTLTGEASDSDGTIESYLWRQTAGINVELLYADTSIASFTAPTIDTDEVLTFELEVTDNLQATATDTVDIVVQAFVEPENSSPTVNAGDDQSVTAESEVTLSGEANDADGTIESYQWRQISGIDIELDNADSATASFTAPVLNSTETLRFELEVTDNLQATATDTVDIVVQAFVEPENSSPTVNAGDDQSVTAESEVTLSGEANDADGTIESYQWRQTSGTSVDIQNADTATATFKAPIVDTDEILIFELTVTDNDQASTTDSVNISIEAYVNQVPTVNAGDDQNVATESEVILSGDANDADGTIESYQWRQTSGTSVNIQNADTATATFKAPIVDTDEILIFELTVTDNDQASTTDTINITIEVENKAPIVDAGDDQVVANESLVTLHGTASDIDGSIVSYYWEQLEGNIVNGFDETQAEIEFTTSGNANIDELTFRLTVTDNEGLTAKDTVTIINSPRIDTVNWSSSYREIDSCLQETANTNNWSLIAEVTSMHCDSLNFELDGLGEIDQFIYLTNLSITNSNLSNISLLSSLPNLINLDLSNNIIRDTSPLLSMTTLVSLDLTGNDNIKCTYLAELESALATTNITRPQTCDDSMLISEIAFSDASLKSCVDQAAINQNWSAASEVTTLYCYNMGIDDLTGIENLVGLAVFSASNNEIEDVSPLSTLPSLWLLQIDSNKIVDFSPLVNISTLKELIIGRNLFTNLSALANANLPSLELFSVAGSQISDLSPIVNIPLVRTLIIGSNSFSDLTPLKQLASLRQLELSYMSGVNLDTLSSLTTLESLFIEDAELSDLSFISGLSNLKVLWAQYNEISNIAGLSSLSQLEELYLRNNNISDLTPISSIPQLRKLSLTSNEVVDITPLFDLTNPSTITLSGNSGISCESLDELRMHFGSSVDIYSSADCT